MEKDILHFLEKPTITNKFSCFNRTPIKAFLFNKAGFYSLCIFYRFQKNFARKILRKSAQMCGF